MLNYIESNVILDQLLLSFRYEIMWNCWHHDPTHRLSFTQVCEGLAAILDENNLPLTHLKENMYEILDKSQVQGEKC